MKMILVKNNLKILDKNKNNQIILKFPNKMMMKILKIKKKKKLVLKMYLIKFFKKK